METPGLIVPIQWRAAREVLGGEASSFTPWLAARLDLLAGALGFDELELVEVEHPIENFRLDIHAVGTDGAGDQFGVVIETSTTGQIMTISAS